jgi:hypothetical protein
MPCSMFSLMPNAFSTFFDNILVISFVKHYYVVLDATLILSSLMPLLHIHMCVLNIIAKSPLTLVHCCVFVPNILPLRHLRYVEYLLYLLQVCCSLSPQHYYPPPPFLPCASLEYKMELHLWSWEQLQLQSFIWNVKFVFLFYLLLLSGFSFLLLLFFFHFLVCVIYLSRVSYIFIIDFFCVMTKRERGRSKFWLFFLICM